MQLNGPLATRARALQAHAARTLRSPLYASSLYLVANSAVNAGLGFFFWVVAARLYSPEEVGLTSTLISTSLLLLFVTNLGLGMTIIRFLPASLAGRSGLINSALSLSSLLAIALGALFLVGTPLWSPALAIINERPLAIIMFLAAVVGSSLITLADDILVVLRHSHLTFRRSLIQGVLKLGLLVALASAAMADGLLTAWAIATVVGALLAIALFLPSGLPGYRPRFTVGRHITPEMITYSSIILLSNGLIGIPELLLPLTVFNLLGSRASAFFFIGWTMAFPLFSISHAVATALFAEGSTNAARLTANVARSFRLLGVLLLPPVLLLLLIGDQVLLLFGKDYSVETAGVMRLIAISSIPVAVNTIYLGIARAQRRLITLLLVPAAMAVGVLVLTNLLTGPLLLLGPATAWLVTQTTVALLILPSLMRLLMSGLGQTAQPAEQGWETGR